MIGHQHISQNTNAAKSLQSAHQEDKSFGLGGTVASGLENKSTVDHPRNAVVKTLTLSHHPARIAVSARQTVRRVWKRVLAQSGRLSLAVFLCYSVFSRGYTMATQPEFIESTAGKVAEELARRGIPPAQRVTITIEPDEPDDWIAKVRAFARPKVIAEGWTDADIDRVIDEERAAVQPRLE